MSRLRKGTSGAPPAYENGVGSAGAVEAREGLTNLEYCNVHGAKTISHCLALTFPWVVVMAGDWTASVPTDWPDSRPMVTRGRADVQYPVRTQQSEHLAKGRSRREGPGFHREMNPVREILKRYG